MAGRREGDGGLMRPTLDRGWLLPALAGAGAAAVTSIAIGVPAPWRDEQATAAAASREWGQLLDLVTGTTDAVHAGYYALMKLWVDVFGVDPFWLRLPSAIAVGFAAAGVVVLGTMLDRTRTGLIAAAVLVLLPRVFWSGGEARSYALQIAAAVWLTVLFVDGRAQGAAGGAGCCSGSRPLPRTGCSSTWLSSGSRSW